MGGDYAGAAAALEQQTAEARRGDDDQLVLALGELGSTRIEQERYEALGNFRSARDLAAARGNNLRLRWEAAHLADVLWRLGRFDDARIGPTDDVSQPPAAQGAVLS